MGATEGSRTRRLNLLVASFRAGISVDGGFARFLVRPQAAVDVADQVERAVGLLIAAPPTNVRCRYVRAREEFRIVLGGHHRWGFRHYLFFLRIQLVC